MQVEYLPSQLHFNIRTEISLEDLSLRATEIFPNAENIEIKDDTLYLYDPNQLIEFIHISQLKVGIIFSPELDNENLENAWIDIKELLDASKVKTMRKLNWQLKVVQPFKSKKERDSVSKKLSPVTGYEANALTLYPSKKRSFYVRVAMVTKAKKEHGFLLNFNYELSTIKTTEVLEQLKSFLESFSDTSNIKAIVKGILGNEDL